MSEEAFAGVKAALDDLLTDAPVLAGMKFVHWYDKPVAAKRDKIEKIFDSAISDEDDEEDETDTPPPEDNPLQARRQADALIGSAKTARLSMSCPADTTYCCSAASAAASWCAPMRREITGS